MQVGTFGEYKLILEVILLKMKPKNKIKTHQAQPIFTIQTEHGEGIIWEEKEQRLYWVDIHQGKYYKANTESLAVESFQIDQPLGVLAVREKGGTVMAVRDGFAFFDEENSKFQLIEPSPEQDNEKVRFNDGAVSPDGRFFAGTMEWNGKEQIAKLFRLDPDLTWKEVEKDIWISNGIGWNMAGNTMFYIDTLQQAVFAYDYDQATGDISNKRTHIKLEDYEFPDGMCLDSDDGFWIAFWGIGKIIHFDKDGHRIEEVVVPVIHPTSCCFGGPNLTTLYISTSQVALSEEEKKLHPLAGQIFVFETNVKGKIEPKFRG